MRLQVITAGLGLALAAGAAQAAEVEIKDAVARVTVIPEARSDIKVEFLTTNSDLPLEILLSNIQNPFKRIRDR